MVDAFAGIKASHCIDLVVEDLLQQELNIKSALTLSGSLAMVLFWKLMKAYTHCSRQLVPHQA